MELDIIGGNYKQRYVNVNPQQTINFFVVDRSDQETNKTKHCLFSTPGLTTLVNIPGSMVRGIYTVNQGASPRCFAVVDDTLYEVFRNGSYNTIGALTGGMNCKCPVYFTMNSNNQLCIIDGNSTAAYTETFTIVTNNSNIIGNVYNLETGVLAAITDINFPNEAANIGRVFFSDVDDSTTWPPNNVFTPGFRAANVTRIFTFRGDIYCFTPQTMEVYLDDGVSPFSLRAGSSVLFGVVAPHTVASVPDGIIFLGKNEFGQPQIYVISLFYQLMQPDNPDSISYQIGKYNDLSDCVGYVQFSKDGHIFYYIHIPAANTTLVYDFGNKQWHQRKSVKPFPNMDGTYDQGMFRGFCHTNFDGLQLFGDRYSGKIFMEDYTNMTEDGNTITRERTTGVYTEEYKSLSVDKLELDVQTGLGTTSGNGQNPQLMVSVSKDKGATFENERLIPLGQLGQYSQRVRVYSMGTMPNWVFKIKLTDPVDCAIIGASVTGSIGLS